jgi:hypothetical protein
MLSCPSDVAVLMSLSKEGSSSKVERTITDDNKPTDLKIGEQEFNFGCGRGPCSSNITNTIFQLAIIDIDASTGDLLSIDENFVTDGIATKAKSYFDYTPYHESTAGLGHDEFGSCARGLFEVCMFVLMQRTSITEDLDFDAVLALDNGHCARV